MTHGRREPPLRVLVAHLGSAAGGNPDLKQLYDPAGPFGAALVRDLTGWRLATRRWDVIHVYWPEWCIRRDRGELVLALDALRFLGLISWARWRGTRVVWSANNLRPHETDRHGLVTAYVAAFARLVDHLHSTSREALDAVTAQHHALRRVPATVAPLGHYRDCYPDTGISRQRARAELGLPPDASIALSIGMIRPYKNTRGLVEAHRGLAGGATGRFLLVAGHCPDAGLAGEIRRACAACPTARADLGYVADADIERYVRAADFVVVSGRAVLNSGSAVLALSFGRPVLLPRAGSLVALHASYGPAWTMLFDGDLTPAVLAGAHERWGRRSGPAGSPDLPSWRDVAGTLHAAFTAPEVPALAGDERGR